MLLVMTAGAAACPGAPAWAHQPGAAAAPPAAASELKPFREKVPAAALELEMLPIPAGSITLPDPEKPGQTRTVAVPALYFSKTEVPWEFYDVFVYNLDGESADGSARSAASDSEKKPADGASGPANPLDAISRPSKPYIPPDRGYGHAGYAAISMTYKGAEEFCNWLSATTGKKYRLATEAEWEHACRAGATGAIAASDDTAWTSENSDEKTHPAGGKTPNAWGLHDMLGNVAEWTVGLDGKPVACGGSFMDAAASVTASSRAHQDPTWNSSDPQFPKSKWWLADCRFVGIRVVCEPSSISSAPAGGSGAKAAPATDAVIDPWHYKHQE